MTVADLQKLLLSLGETLGAAGAKTVGGDLAYVAQKLEPFREQKLKAFGDFLEQAEAHSRGGLGGKTSKSGGRAAAGRERLEAALGEVQQLYDKALEADLTEESINARVRQYADLSKPQLEELAKRFGISRKLKTKEDILKAVIQKIIDRKGAYERAQV